MLECSSKPLEPTKEEEVKVGELQVLIKEHLLTTTGKEAVRQALENYHNDEQLLLKYVRGRKLNLKKAFASLICFAEVKHVKYPELFPAKVPDFVLYAFQCEVVTVLKQLDELRRTIVLCSASKWDESRITLEDFICVGTYLADMLMCNPGFLKNGLVLIIDCKGVTLSNLRQFTLPALIKFLSLFWQAYPIMIKGLYVVNASIFAKPIALFLKPFLPSKLKDRFILTSGVSDIHKRISPDILPQRVGGNLLDEEVQSQPVLNYFTELCQSQ